MGAAAVGGIPEVVVDGETGFLVPYDPARADDPEFVAAFEADFAAKVNTLTADPGRAERFGLAGRQRCIDEFSWAKIAAEQTGKVVVDHDRGPVAGLLSGPESATNVPCQASVLPAISWAAPSRHVTCTS